MFRTFGLTSILFTLSFFALADEPRYRNHFVSSDGRYEAKIETFRGPWRITEKATGNELYRFDDYYRDGIWFSSMTLVISNDPKYLVAVNDYGENYGEQNVRKNPEVLFFFRDGKLFKTVRLLDVANPKFMEFSVSHFRWLYSANKLSINDSKIEFTTLDLNHFVFDTVTGALLKKELDNIFSKRAVFVYGEVRSLGEHRYEITVECSVRGNAKKGSQLTFSSEEIGWKGGGFNESLVLQDGRLVDRKGIIFNNCN